MTQIAGNVCHRLEVLNICFFFGFSNPLGGQMQYHKNYSCYVCTVDLVGQGCLTIILTISISVIRSARKMIIFLISKFLGRQIQ